ncbi:MAG: transposase, partial [Treponema sp.]|nr:transposase [Treponema sp.]
FRIRWPGGFICAHCGCTRYYPITRGEARANGARRAKPGRDQYECSLCGRQFSITGGTCMHKSRLPLRTWFEAAALYSASRDISAVEFARKLELTKPTAWLLLKKIKQGLKSGERILLGNIASAWLRAHENTASYTTGD